MKKLNLVVSLPGETKYLREQKAVAEATAQRMGFNLTVLNANGDAVLQSQQLLGLVQSGSASAPDAMLVEPVNATGLPRVAEAAAAAGIAWVISNTRVDYLEALRTTAKAPVFAISQDHAEIGRIQGKQLAALLPQGGSVLYLRGPATNYLANQRTEGMESAIPKSVRIKTLKIQWTQQNAHQSISSWLHLSTVHAADIDVVSAQNTDFILAARHAFGEHPDNLERSTWLKRPCTGVGVQNQIKPLIDDKTLAAGVVTSTTMDKAIEMLAEAVAKGSQPPAYTFVQATSVPTLEELAMKRRGQSG